MFDLATLLMSGYSNGLCAAGSDQDGAIGALRVIFNVVGSLVPIPFALDITTRYIRKCVLNSQLEHLFRWSLGYSKGESHKNVSVHRVVRIGVIRKTDIERRSASTRLPIIFQII